jgi:alcohol dehydrogenase class IV
VHGLAGPIGGLFGAPHGAVCAALLPHVAAANLAAAQARQPGGATLARLEEVGRLVTGNVNARASDTVDWLAALVADLEIPPLSAWGVDAASVPVIVAQAVQSSSMKGNPVELTGDELASVINAAL